MSTGVAVVLMTAPSEEVAASIGRTLVEEGLIACANLVPQVRSLYRWEGKLCDEREVLVVMKGAQEKYDALEARIRALHPYTVPEVLRLDVSAGAAPYLSWILSP